MATQIPEVYGDSAVRPAPSGVGRWFERSNAERARAVYGWVRDQDPARESLAPVQELDARTGGMVGTSAALKAVLARARKVAPTEATVLVTGETGTGKELLARAIHGWSRRDGGPFLSVNCAAIPQTLIASELFGHERGAFTGALQRRLGRFEQAAGGTLFLDEVGELPSETQVLLLRVLQEREFERVGGTGSLPADVRVVAATNRDLRKAVEDGRFRSDLYYRLAVFPLEMPPLRNREGDLRLLVEHFVRRSAQTIGKTIRGIDPEALERLAAHPWPGNVRELENVIERSIIVCESETFTVDPSWRQSEPAREAEPADPRSDAAPSSLGMPTLAEVQREAILRALHSSNWIIGGAQGAAALLGLKRTTLQARMQKLGIAPLRPTVRRTVALPSAPDTCLADNRNASEESTSKRRIA